MNHVDMTVGVLDEKWSGVLTGRAVRGAESPADTEPAHRHGRRYVGSFSGSCLWEWLMWFLKGLAVLTLCGGGWGGGG